MVMVSSITLDQTLKLPVKVLRVESKDHVEEPKILAGGVTVTPINIVLSRRRRDKAASEASIATYLRAAYLYVQFCAHLRRSIIDITNHDFKTLRGALLGERFLDANGELVRLDGERSERTADLMVALMYSIAGDIEQLYDVRFDWRRYENLPEGVITALRVSSNPRRNIYLVRQHRIKHAIPKALGLPDGQFARVIRRARELWLDVIPDGDRAYIHDPKSLEKQRGALFYRNLGILLMMGGEGARRSEVDPLTFDDLDPENNLIYLVTKGHGGEKGERLPVLMQPVVFNSIFHYATDFRPTVNIPEVDKRHIFLSHSPRNYGQRITPETVRKIVDVLREALDEPWRKRTTPHKFRHRFAYQLQRLGGPLAVVSNMRHASLSSLDAYSADIEAFADELLAPMNMRLQELVSKSIKISEDDGGAEDD
jgi:integrase